MKPIIIYGNSTMAKQVYLDAAQHDSELKIAAFCASDEFLRGEQLFCDVPLVKESEVLQEYSPDKYDMLSCVDAPSRLRNRIMVYEKLKSMGYNLINYVSPAANISPLAKLSENNVFFAHCHVYFDASFGHSNTVRSTAIVGHEVVVGSGTNISEGAVIGGNAQIGDSCWIGMNGTINNRVVLANDTLVASGAVVMQSTRQGFSYIGNPAKAFFSHEETGIMLDFGRWGKRTGGENEL